MAPVAVVEGAGSLRGCEVQCVHCNQKFASWDVLGIHLKFMHWVEARAQR